MRPALVLSALLLIVASAAAHAGKIYKWTDEQGRVHFGTQPPTVDQTDVVGEASAPPVAGSTDNASSGAISPSRLKGYWKGTRLGKEIGIVFDERGRFIETVNYRGEGRSARFKRSYGGYWSQRGTRIYFDVQYEDQGAQYIAPIEYAATIKLEGSKLSVVWDRDIEVLEKQYQTAFPAIPDEY